LRTVGSMPMRTSTQANKELTNCIPHRDEN
jgi:hypothetical protein